MRIKSKGIIEYTNRINIKSVINQNENYLTYKDSKHIIEKQSVNYGGYRYYFRCYYCNSRVKDLYVKGGYLACRHCLKLVYYDCIKHKTQLQIYLKTDIIKNKIEYLRNNHHKKRAGKLKWKLLLNHYPKAIKELIDFRSKQNYYT